MTVEETARLIIDRICEAIDNNSDDVTLAKALRNAENEIIAAFGWRPIAEADHLKIPPKNKLWGRRVVVLVKGEPTVVYWDPDSLKIDLKPIPHWRVAGTSKLHSLRNQPTHFLVPYALR